MHAADVSISPEARDAWLLNDLVDSTAQPGETPAAARERRAVIHDLFRGLAPANAVQAMVACHCIGLRFVLAAILRDAMDPALDPRLRARAQGREASSGRMLRDWMRTYEKMRGPETVRVADPPPAPVARPAADPPVASTVPPRGAEPAAVPRPQARAAKSVVPVPDWMDDPVLAVPRAGKGLKRALLSGAAMVSGGVEGSKFWKAGPSGLSGPPSMWT
jgi:hypothetical protein